MSRSEQVYLNGEFVPHEDARVSVEDRGFNFADGIYEVVRVVAGRTFRLRDHLDRLVRGAEALEIPLPLQPDEIGGIMAETANRNGVEEGFVYLQLTRGYARRSHGFPSDVRPTLVMFARPFEGRSEEERSSGVSVITEPDRRWGLCEIKTIGLLPNVLAGERAARAGAYEAILVRHGVVTEGSRSSAFCVRDGSVFTHPIDNILPGITRGLIVDGLRDRGVEVNEEPVRLGTFREADEIFLTGTTTEALPVVEFDGDRVGDGTPGPITAQAMDLYRTAIEAARAGDPAF